ncbi:Phosphoenolpyruvate/pyruvate domain-containing protein [Dacryopinax primogenitus]|uniref:Phosphoenolpyruvate/pyruvate domain-containing protein n=1 Tax=Dacryopinax primogenitus (strain DJM 731) TaxID=1858805 RepID=M5GBR4_DACPD|nr:Phosphoenolpyruvate/pyruvate domain-containing protein [Dacryopinax primogenitus]EJU01458.1 Phosphoenolpyruvate/pyruvate domain-containing protein [Dacryopinax primogenitus]
MAGQMNNKLLQTLRAGKQTFGIWQMINSPAISRTLSLLGPDWICVDCEHGNIDDAGMHEAIHNIRAPVTPLVRIPDNQNVYVKRALDAGAQGLCVPMVNTVEQAKYLVESVYFPPQGKRGLGSPYAMASYASNGVAPSLGDYFFNANAQILLMVQIETEEAVKNVDEIAALEGVHMLMVGPFDLSNSLGVPLVRGETDKLKEAIGKIQASAEKHGKWCGIYSTSPEDAARRAREGWHFIALGSEMSFLQTGIVDGLRIARGGETKQSKEVPY